MKKTFWTFVLCCIILGTMYSNELKVVAVESVQTSQESMGSSEVATPYFWGHYTKTVVRYFIESDPIPESIYYEEYVEEHNGTFSGTLKRVNIEYTSYGTVAVTYSGELYGHM